ncbi:MAG: VWA domain-containing protein [Halioglobus sp.]|nr:VWA domain-containing protein [Halioglobus sp.]
MLPELTAVQYFHFLRPEWALLLIPWVAMVLIKNKQRAHRDMFGGIIAPHLLEHLRLQRFDTRWFNPRNVSVAFMVLALLVLMGPTWRQQPSPLNQDEAALVILLDTSASMQQKDIQPSRLQRAKQKISDLLALRPDKKTALIVYSGTAHTVLSLTADQDILNQYLASIAPAIMPRTGKFPEYTLPLVDEILRQTSAPATLVLLTDGLGADSDQAFEDYFTTSPHQLLVVGVGTETEESGLAPLERASLEELAAQTGGDYISLTIDDRDVRQLNRGIDSHYVVVDDSALPWLDSGYALVFPAMALFLMWFRRGWTLTWAWILLPVVLSSTGHPVMAQEEPSAAIEKQTSAVSWFTDLWLTGDQQGRLLMQFERYPEAATRFSDPMWKGMAYYYAEEFMLAAEYFSRRDSDDALFDEANARAQGRDYVRAVNRYDRLLARAPDFPGAASNRVRVQAIIDEINRLSESQQQETGDTAEGKELGGDDAIPAQGADEMSWQQAEIKQLTAEDILQDPATSDMWLRSVQQDPSNFLAIKFAMQLQNRETASDKSSQDMP